MLLFVEGGLFKDGGHLFQTLFSCLLGKIIVAHASLRLSGKSFE